MLLEENENIFCKNQIRIQNMYEQFKYEKLHISAKTTEIKLLCIKLKPHVKILFLENSLI